ncbi:MAG TPA: BglII/BstYI family type II restriction endonuclease [Ktedonobacteraceae bacterium]|nr:BglII/BstYI family type II restriction endonuclease [Ktedonobacteraceae bacterium]
MLIAGIYSFNNGKEAIKKLHSSELEEVLQVIEAVDAVYCKTKVSKEKTMKNKVLYSPPALDDTFKEQFTSKGWINHKVIAEYSKEYYVPGYTPPARSGREQAPFRDMDFVKNQLGIEVQFGKYSFMVYNVCAKMTIFAKLGVIDCGIEIVPVKAFAEEMSSGVSYFEQFVWDLEHRGVSDIDIPVLILGIDTDGLKPRDLKIAEPRQQYLFVDEILGIQG